jgi:hypothetical protein
MDLHACASAVVCTEQSKAKQSKAKQSKAKQSKAKQHAPCSATLAAPWQVEAGM